MVNLKTGIFSLMAMSMLSNFCLSTSVKAINNDELSQICGAMENSIRDIYVEYERYTDPPYTIEDINGTGFIDIDPDFYKWAAVYPFEEKSFSEETVEYMDQDKTTFNMIRKQSYDGQVAKFLEIIKKQNALRANTGGSITKSKRFVLDQTATPLNLTLYKFKVADDTPISERLKKKEEIEIDNQIKDVNNFKTICASFFVPTKLGGRVYLKIYFSVEHGYTPIKIEKINNKGEVGFSATVDEPIEVSDNFWFPKRGRVQLGNDRHQICYKINQVKINQGLKDEIFDINFPPGTKVADEITGKQYTIKPTQEQLDQSLPK